MSTGFVYNIKRIPFDEHYQPASGTRITTNFANLARGARRQDNLRNALRMINSRFNTLAYWDNPKAERYSVELEIISVAIDIDGSGHQFPSLEMLQTHIVDHVSGQRLAGIVGNNFSSYVRDYDFSVRLRQHHEAQSAKTLPDDFGVLHGNLFKDFIHSASYREQFDKAPVICLSVSSKAQYRRSGNQHPVLGVEYCTEEESLTSQYFAKMGLHVRYFMPPNSVAPLAFYFAGDLLSDYSNLELISTISTMETFQKIYRPEIYNANAVAGAVYQPNLQHADHSLTQIAYDREERSELAVKQGQFAEEHFIKRYHNTLAAWSAQQAC